MSQNVPKCPTFCIYFRKFLINVTLFFSATDYTSRDCQLHPARPLGCRIIL